MTGVLRRRPLGLRAGPLRRRAEPLAVGALALLAVLLFAVAPTYPNYDAYYHLVWGRELLDGATPTFEAYGAPTPHPLYLLLAAALGGAFGEDADRALVLITVLSLVAVVWAAFRLGRATLGTWPAVAGAFFVASSFMLLLFAVRGYVDVPFLAIVLWAGVLEAERGPRRGAGPLALLAVAGLLRPEAWVLAGLYWLWCLPDSTWRRRLALGGLVAVAPLAWAAVDLAVTGNPLHSVSATSALAEELGRDRGVAKVPGAFAGFLADALRPPVFAAALLGLAAAVWLRRSERLVVPLGLLAGGIIAFVGTGLAGLSILPRYLTVPAVVLSLFAGYALLGFTTLPPGAPLRRPWAWVAGALAVAGLAFAVVRAPVVERLVDELRFTERTHEDLRATLTDPRVRNAMRCGPLTFPSYRLVPDARWMLDAPRERVSARSARRRAGGAAVFVVGRKALRRYGFADGVSPRTNVPDPGFTPLVRHGTFSVYSACPPGTTPS